jgi:ABC-type hemin transport system ATPase subunit
MALKDGRLAAFGPAAQVLTPELMGAVFEVQARVTGAGPNAYVDVVGLT